MNNIYEKVVLFVDEAFGVKRAHFERAVYWLEQFLDECTEAHKIAAYAHDIERALRPKSIKASNNYLDEDFLTYHQERGADIMAEFLKKEGAPDEVIEIVVHLISKHEVGGDDQQNAMKDADSVSFLETNAERFVREFAPEQGYQKVKPKLDWMFDRISSDAAKEAARANYEYWTLELEKLNS